MDEIYQKIWELAKPYYKRGRSYDIPHIKWMMEKAQHILNTEKFNGKLLLPICILHDVGYGEVTKDKNPQMKNKEVKIEHMEAGAKIADKILRGLELDDNLIKDITRYISVHDNWILGDNTPYQQCREMALFNDLDFLWVTSSWDVFTMFAKSTNMSPQKFYEFWRKDEKLINRPFCCNQTQKIWNESLEKIKNHL